MIFSATFTIKFDLQKFSLTGVVSKQ